MRLEGLALQGFVDFSKGDMTEEVTNKIEVAKGLLERPDAMPIEKAAAAIGYFRVTKVRTDGERKIQHRINDEPMNEFMQWSLYKHLGATKRKGPAPKGNLERLIAATLGRVGGNGKK